MNARRVLAFIGIALAAISFFAPIPLAVPVILIGAAVALP